MKKLMSLILACVLILSLCACGGQAQGGVGEGDAKGRESGKAPGSLVLP